MPPDAISPLFESIFDLGYWSYTTVAVETTRPFEPIITDPESLELRWIGLDDVAELPLHPFFAKSWPALRLRL